MNQDNDTQKLMEAYDNVLKEAISNWQRTAFYKPYSDTLQQARKNIESTPEAQKQKTEEIFTTEDGHTLKVKVVKDREWDEWQIRILELIGNKWVNHRDLMAPAADLEDAINTMPMVVNSYKKAGELKKALANYEKGGELYEER